MPAAFSFSACPYIRWQPSKAVVDVVVTSASTTTSRFGAKKGRIRWRRRQLGRRGLRDRLQRDFRQELREAHDPHLGHLGLDELSHETANVRLRKDDAAGLLSRSSAKARRTEARTSRAACGGRVKNAPAAAVR